MNTDWSKLFLFVVLSLVVLVMVSDTRRPLASAPLDGDTATDESQTLDDRSLITRGPGWANVACNDVNVPPLSLMMPRQGVQPSGGC
jgi:hypothetical protein